MAETIKRPQMLLGIGVLGVSSIIAQLALLREMLGAFYGNEMVVGILLGNWLLLTGLGAWLARVFRADDRDDTRTGLISRIGTVLYPPARIFAVGQVALAILPITQIVLLRGLRNLLFVRGALVDPLQIAMTSFVLLLPLCLLSGYLLVLGCNLLAQQQGPAGAAHGYVADTLGSISGGLGFSLVLVPYFNHLTLLGFPAALNLMVAAWISYHSCKRLLLVIGGLGVVWLVAIGFSARWDAWTTAWLHPGQNIVYLGDSPYGRVVVTEAGGQFTFFENGVPVVANGEIQKIEESVHFAMAQRPDVRNVLLISGGISGTALEILKYGVSHVTYVELDPLIIQVGRRFFPEALADPRMETVNTDGRLYVQHSNRSYDIIIADLPEPTTSQLNRFYTEEFFREAKRVLSPGGVLAFALGHYENYVSPELARLLGSAYRTAHEVFAHLLVIPGGRVTFLASDGPLTAEIADRLEARHIPTKWVKRSMLATILHADRLADLQRILALPSAINTDSRPVLYYYHLRHWASQFGLVFGGWAVGALLGIGGYVLLLRPVPRVIFASGFAATSLEMVLLLVFQTLCGSLYREIGVITALFMAGLAVGAFWCKKVSDTRNRHGLLWTALAVALFAFGLPLVLTVLGSARAAFPLLVSQTVIGLLVFVLAVLVGMEFALANQLEFARPSPTTSRIYTADFVGASLGAFAASTLLIPLLGVTVACGLSGGLNLLSGAALILQRGHNAAGSRCT